MRRVAMISLLGLLLVVSLAAAPATGEPLVYGGLEFTNPGDGTILAETPPLRQAVKAVTVKYQVASDTSVLVFVDVRDARGNVLRAQTIMAGDRVDHTTELSEFTAAATDRIRARLIGAVQGTIRLSLVLE
jgi:hypothetical protein